MVGRDDVEAEVSVDGGVKAVTNCIDINCCRVGARLVVQTAEFGEDLIHLHIIERIEDGKPAPYEGHRAIECRFRLHQILGEFPFHLLVCVEVGRAAGYGYEYDEGDNDGGHHRCLDGDARASFP